MAPEADFVDIDGKFLLKFQSEFLSNCRHFDTPDSCQSYQPRQVDVIHEVDVEAEPQTEEDDDEQALPVEQVPTKQTASTEQAAETQTEDYEDQARLRAAYKETIENFAKQQAAKAKQNAESEAKQSHVVNISMNEMMVLTCCLYSRAYACGLF